MKKSILQSVAILILIGLATGCSKAPEDKTAQSLKIKEALTIMKSNAAKLGEAKVAEGALIFGTTKINDNYKLVDALKSQFSCTATFFIKKGDKFIRISTNVMKDGKRALGTQLDPNGPVIVAIRKGEAFYGTTDILGSQYETGYEPIKDASSEIIGIYYIGYQIN